jgi:cytochrome P450
VGDVDAAGVTVAAGSTVVVGLAAAQRAEPSAGAGDAPLTFGAGPHACPGRAHAVALAAGVISGLAALGARHDGGPVDHEPRPNVRMPVSLVVSWPPAAASSPAEARGQR